jgi:hypothetical protein
LTEEIRALPGFSALQGLSAFGPTSEGIVEITVHTEGKALDDEQERAVAEAVERHVPDAQWNASQETKELDALLAKAEASLSLADIERALRILSTTVERRLPQTVVYALAEDGSNGE